MKIENGKVILTQNEYFSLVYDKAGICTRCGAFYYDDVPETLVERDCHCYACNEDTVRDVEDAEMSGEIDWVAD